MRTKKNAVKTVKKGRGGKEPKMMKKAVAIKVLNKIKSDMSKIMRAAIRQALNEIKES